MILTTHHISVWTVVSKSLAIKVDASGYIIIIIIISLVLNHWLVKWRFSCNCCCFSYFFSKKCSIPLPVSAFLVAFGCRAPAVHPLQTARIIVHFCIITTKKRILMHIIVYLGRLLNEQLNAFMVFYHIKNYPFHLEGASWKGERITRITCLFCIMSTVKYWWKQRRLLNNILYPLCSESALDVLTS